MPDVAIMFAPSRFVREVLRMTKCWISDRGLALALSAVLASGALATPAAAQQRLQSGLYTGAYVCGQGLTALRLAVEGPEGNVQVGVFDFGGNSGIPAGAYTVRITGYRDGSYSLTPLRWIRRPSGYNMVGARLQRHGDELNGTITDARCRGITLRGPVRN
ncbi:MAG TPA: hypothetical protein VGO55_13585 [Allosphingosinicella sp.]|jgi:hypothetical protein|nr:hypothetical protein [Allosphingosinicella sp.]